MAFEGSLKDFHLADIVQLIGLQRKTGVLTLEGFEDEVGISFQDGQVVWAQSRQEPLDDRMRRALRLRGLVTETQMAEAERVHAETGQRLGYVLVHRLVLSEEEWQRALALEVEEVLYRVFRWREGTYRFEVLPRLDLSDGRVPPVAAEAFLMEGIRRVDEWPLIAQRVPSLETVFSRARPAEEIDLTGLSFKESRVLELVDGRMTAGEVVDASGLGEFEACKALASLVGAGIVGPRAAAAVAAAAEPARPVPGRPWLAAWTSWGMWGFAALWLAINLALFQPWATFLPSRLQVDLLKQVRARTDLATLGLYLDQYLAEVGSFPRDLGALVHRGMVDPAMLRDPWGHPYRYEVQGDRYRLLSLGAGPPRADGGLTQGSEAR